MCRVNVKFALLCVYAKFSVVSVGIIDRKTIFPALHFSHRGQRATDLVSNNPFASSSLLTIQWWAMVQHKFKSAQQNGYNRNHAKELPEPKTSNIFVVLSCLTLLRIILCALCVHTVSNSYVYIHIYIICAYPRMSWLLYTEFSIYWMEQHLTYWNDGVWPAIVALTSLIFDKLCTCLRLSTHQITCLYPSRT